MYSWYQASNISVCFSNKIPWKTYIQKKILSLTWFCFNTKNRPQNSSFQKNTFAKFLDKIISKILIFGAISNIFQSLWNQSNVEKKNLLFFSNFFFPRLIIHFFDPINVKKMMWYDFGKLFEKFHESSLQEFFKFEKQIFQASF